MLQELGGIPPKVLATSELMSCLPALCLALRAAQATRTVPGTDRRRRFGWLITAAVALLVMEGQVCGLFGWPTAAFLASSALVFFPVLLGMGGLGVWRTLFLVAVAAFLAVDVAFVAMLVDVLAQRGTAETPYLELPGLVAQWCTWAALAVPLCRMAASSMPRLLRSANLSRRTWRTLWLVPTTLTVVLVLARPPFSGQESVLALAWSSALPFAAINLLTCMLFQQVWLIARQAERRVEVERELARATLQRKQLSHLSERIRSTRNVRHDLRHHAAAINALLSVGDVEGAQAYLRKLTDVALTDSPMLYCADAALNACLVYYVDLAGREGAKADMVVRLPDQMPQRPTEVLSVVANLLENAIAGVRDFRRTRANQRPLLRVRLEHKAGNLFVTVDNSCAPEQVRRAGDGFVSTKHDGVGVGVRSVRDAAQRSGGVCHFEVVGDEFRASVMLGAK